MKKVFTIIMFLVLQFSFSQKLKEIKTSLTIDQHKNGEIVSKLDNLFKNDSTYYKSTIYNESYNRKDHSIDRKFRLISEKGKKIELNKNEYPLSIKNNKAYTFIQNVGLNKKRYRIFDLNNPNDMSNSTELSLMSNMHILKNGDIILTEGGHGGVDWAEICSPEFKTYQKFQPFNDLSHLVFDDNEDYVVFVAQIDVNPVLRLSFYGAYANRGLIKTKELKIKENNILSSVKLIKDRVIVLLSSINSPSSSLLILNPEFELIKEINLQERVSYNKIVGNKDFYINCPSEIINFDKDGNTLWSYKKEKFKYTKVKKGYKFTSQNIDVLDDDHLIITQAEFEDGKAEIRNVKLKVLNKKEQKIIQTVNLQQPFSKKIIVKNEKDKLFVFGEKELLKYEKL